MRHLHGEEPVKKKLVVGKRYESNSQFGAFLCLLIWDNLNNVHSTVLSKVFSCKSILNPEITLGMMENIKRKQINVNKLHILLIVLKLLIIEVKINFCLLF